MYLNIRQFITDRIKDITIIVKVRYLRATTNRPVELFATRALGHAECIVRGGDMRLRVMLLHWWREVGVKAQPGMKGKAVTWPTVDSGHHDASHGWTEVKVLQSTTACVGVGGHCS